MHPLQRPNKSIKLGFIKTSKIELIDIGKAWIAISVAFALVFSGINLVRGTLASVYSLEFLIMFLISLFTAGIGFLLHELAHKFSAQHYGCTAEFRAFDQMLYLAMGLAAVIGFIFAAPGAVMIAGHITRKENGIISAAGPLTNFVLAMIFLGLNFTVPSLGLIWSTGFMINMWLGLFNMLPFGNFDGKKILAWSKAWWVGGVVIGLLLLFVF
mgnify:CR=1 FL=1